MVKLTGSIKQQITIDWQRMFPNFKAYKPMWLARRVGPIVQGILLERDGRNDQYLPVTHIHNLCRRRDFVSISLYQGLARSANHGVQWIPVQFHEKQHVWAAQIIKNQCLLPLVGNWEINQVLHALGQYRKLGRSDAIFPVSYFEDAVSWLCWNKDLVAANRYLDQSTTEMLAWPASVQERLGGVLVWRDRMLEIIHRADTISDLVAEQAIQLGVTDLPMSDLL